MKNGESRLSFMENFDMPFKTLIKMKAKYAGDCAYCSETINVGDDLSFFKDNAHHYRCAVVAQADAEKPLTHEQKTRPGYL